MNHDSSATRIAAAIERDLVGLAAGARLPSQRELVARHSASASTIAQAIALLTQRGLVESRPGAGSFRATPRPAGTRGDSRWQDAALELTEHLDHGVGGERRYVTGALGQTLGAYGAVVVDLNGGYLHPSLGPTTLLSASLTRVSRRAEAWERPPAAGVPELRDWFARDIAPDLGRSDILVAPGGQAALATTLRALTQPGDTVVVESPTYPGTLAAALAAGLRPRGLPLDGEGLVPSYLDEALTRTHARVVVVQPLHHNPTGVTMGAERRREIRAVARAHDAFVIEDDFARHLTHTDASTPPAPMIADDGDGTVIHLRSLTKPTSPNLRIAAIAARGPVMRRLREAAVTDALLVPALLQHTALDVVTAPGWRRAQRDLAENLRRRRDACVTHLVRGLGADVLDVVNRGGYHLWLTCPDERDGAEVASAALAAGVAVTPGANYYQAGHGGVPRVRLSYVAAPDEAELERGVARLVEVLRD